MALRRLHCGINSTAIATGATIGDTFQIGDNDGYGDRPYLIKKITFSLTSDARVTWALIIYKTADITPHAVMMDNMDYTSYRFKTEAQGSILYRETFKTGIVVEDLHRCRLIARQENVNNASIFADAVIWVVEDL